MRGASGNCTLSEQPVVPERSMKCEQEFWGCVSPGRHSLPLQGELSRGADLLGL